MKHNDIKLVAVDIDGTFIHSDYTYDIRGLSEFCPAWRRRAAGLW